MTRKEEIQKAAEEYYDEVKYLSDLSAFPIAAFKAGAEWADKTVCEWLEDNIYDYLYINRDGTMSNEDWKKAEELTYSILDSIDLVPYIKKHKNIGGLINELENEYDESPEVSNELLQGCLFNVIGPEEFIDYLEKRYEGKFTTYEVTIRNIIFKE